MKKFLVLLLMPFAMAQAQYPIYTFYPQVITQNIHGGAIQKNDTIAVTIKVNAKNKTNFSIFITFHCIILNRAGFIIQKKIH